MDYWENKLTPFDMELCVMVESLTGKPCKPKNGGEHFYIVVDYSGIKDKDTINAIMDAVAGRVGDRLIKINDYPESDHFTVLINFSKTHYPGLIYLDRNIEENPAIGDVFCRQLDEIRAIQVTRQNAGRLLAFVGNGELECPKDGPVTYHFRNTALSVYAHAPENSYIAYIGPGHFQVWAKDLFESKFEPK